MRCDRHGEQPGSYCFLCEGQYAAAVDRGSAAPAKPRAPHSSMFLADGLARLGRKRAFDQTMGNALSLGRAAAERARDGVDREPSFDAESVDWSAWR